MADGVGFLAASVRYLVEQEFEGLLDQDLLDLGVARQGRVVWDGVLPLPCHEIKKQGGLANVELTVLLSLDHEDAPVHDVAAAVLDGPGEHVQPRRRGTMDVVYQCN
jgi:hypothetical protein